MTLSSSSVSLPHCSLALPFSRFQLPSTLFQSIADLPVIASRITRMTGRGSSKLGRTGLSANQADRRAARQTFRGGYQDFGIAPGGIELTHGADAAQCVA